MNAGLLKQAIAKSIRRVIRGPQPPPPKPKAPVFSIGIYAGESPLALRPAANVKNPVLTAASVSDVPAVFVADPFMIQAGGLWHMFFEVLNGRSGLGEIGVASSSDAVHWKYRQIVLREPFHLSYPYVFEWENEYYMIPESYQARSVRLYKAVEFPLAWSFVGDLLTGDDFEDSSVFRFNDRWWLLNDLSRAPYYAGTLRLFFSDRLDGPWTEHPKSPVVDQDPHIARPAGRVVTWNGKVIRFTQDCSPVYGIQVRAFELTELTPTTFREQELNPSPVLQGSGSGWNESGMHHLDPHLQPDGQWIACVDGWHWNS
jgi:hypothetical protein